MITGFLKREKEYLYLDPEKIMILNFRHPAPKEKMSMMRYMI